MKGLLNGKRPPEQYFYGEKSNELALALSARIAVGVAPSLCAHAMCSSASVGNVAVVKMLADLPMSAFNKAYKFSEPLRRAIRAYLRFVDDPRREDFKVCAQILVAAKADLYLPDKNSPSGMTAAKILIESGKPEAIQFLEDLKAIRKGWGEYKSAVKSTIIESPMKPISCKRKEQAKANDEELSDSTKRTRRSLRD